MKSQVYHAPEEVPYDRQRLFLAGGITDCYDWQSDIIEKLLANGTRYNLIDPRRPDFDVTDPNMAEDQIRWEHKQLMASAAILFWFPHETLCPITLYELGAHSQRRVPLFVGVHPGYKRRKDVEVQTHLCRREIQVAYSLDDLVEQVREHEATQRTLQECNEVGRDVQLFSPHFWSGFYR